MLPPAPILLTRPYSLSTTCLCPLQLQCNCSFLQSHMNREFVGFSSRMPKSVMRVDGARSPCPFSSAPSVFRSICGSVHPSVRLFFASLEVLRGFQSHGGRGISSLHGQGRPSVGRKTKAAVAGRRTRENEIARELETCLPSLPPSLPLPLVFAQTRKPRSLPFCCQWASLPPVRAHPACLSVCLCMRFPVQP